MLLGTGFCSGNEVKIRFSINLHAPSFITLVLKIARGSPANDLSELWFEHS